jgi:hypothetical protein
MLTEAPDLITDAGKFTSTNVSLIYNKYTNLNIPILGACHDHTLLSFDLTLEKFKTDEFDY